VSSGEVQNAVVIRIANEHVPKHPLDAAKVLGIADEVGTELLVADGSERHVLAVDLQIVAVFIANVIERDVRVCRFFLLGHLHVIQLGAADRALLLLRTEPIPRIHVVQILLHDHVTAAPVLGVLITHQHSIFGRGKFWILRTIHESQQVAIIEELEAVRLIHNLCMAFQALADQRCQLETHIHMIGSQVDQQVTRGGYSGVFRPADLFEWMETSGTLGVGKKTIPQPTTDSDHAQ